MKNISAFFLFVLINCLPLPPIFLHLYMKPAVFRLNFIDVIRAFAITMMLQGHFIGGLMAERFRDSSNWLFSVWYYCTGITAPVFFTVSGFIFMYLMVKESDQKKLGWNNPRVQKGIKRGGLLLAIAYLLRMRFEYVDILHCIGLSLLLLVAIYLLTYNKNKNVTPITLLSVTLLLFTFEPVYRNLTYDNFPLPIANYFTRMNGTIFSIFPWFGYVSFGAFMGVLFNRYKDNVNLYRNAIILFLVGGILLLNKHWFFKMMYEATGSDLFYLLYTTEYMFLRLSNVLFVFAFFALMRNVITSKFIQTIGQNTLSIYVIHSIILYGGLTGMGLQTYFSQSLNPYVAIVGAVLFIALNIWLSFKYNQLKPVLDQKIRTFVIDIKSFIRESYYFMSSNFYKVRNRILFLLLAFKRSK